VLYGCLSGVPLHYGVVTEIKAIVKPVSVPARVGTSAFPGLVDSEKLEVLEEFVCSFRDV
jgi:hypothetical protein